VGNQLILYFKNWLKHRDVRNRLRFFVCGNHAAIVITQNHNGFSQKVGTKNLLAAGVKAVAIYQGNHRA
jgi:hypothetical protein